MNSAVSAKSMPAISNGSSAPISPPSIEKPIQYSQMRAVSKMWTHFSSTSSRGT